MNRITGLIIFLSMIVFFDSNCKSKSIPSYSFVLRDSLIVDGSMEGLSPVDVNSKGEVLFASETSDTVFMTDPGGRIYSKITPLGSGDEKIGDWVYNVGLFEDSLILIAGSRGYFIYSKYGPFKRAVSSINKEGLAYTKRIKPVINPIGDTVLLSEFRANFSYERLARDTVPDKDFQKEKRFLTWYSLRNNNYKIGIGYENGTIFEKADFIKKYIFDISGEDTALYFVASPESTINIYKFTADTLSLKERVNFEMDHFKTDIFFDFGRERKKLHDAFFINSMINDINVDKDIVAITYSTGVPSKGWLNTSFDNNEERAEYIKNTNEFYLVLLRKADRTKLSADIRLPANTSGICAFRGLDYILMQPNLNKGPYSTMSKFYIYGLKKSDNDHE